MVVSNVMAMVFDVGVVVLYVERLDRINSNPGVPAMIAVRTRADDHHSNDYVHTDRHADAEVIVEPGTTGFVQAFIHELPSPFDCDPMVLVDFPVYNTERD